MDHHSPSQNVVPPSMIATMTSIHSAPTTPTVPSHPPTPSPKVDRHFSYPPVEQMQQGSFYGGAYQTMVPVSGFAPTAATTAAAGSAGNGDEINKPIDVGPTTSHLYSQSYHQYVQPQPMHPAGQVQPSFPTLVHGYQPLYSPTNVLPMVSPSMANPNLPAGVNVTASEASPVMIRTTWSPAPMAAAAGGGGQDSLAGMLVPAKTGSVPTVSPVDTDPASLSSPFFVNGPATAQMHPPPHLPPFNNANNQALPPLNIVMSSVYQGSDNSSVPTMPGGYALPQPQVHASAEAPAPAPVHASAAAPGTAGYRVRLKPPMPYPMLLALCILEAPNARLTLRQIYEALRSKYPEIYRETARRFSSWENTVRYNLSRCGIFEKIARRNAEGNSTTNGVNEPSSKGSWWTIKQEWQVKIQTHGLDSKEKTEAEEGGAGLRKRGSKSARAAAVSSSPEQMGAAALAEPATTTEPLAVPGMLSPSVAAPSMTDSLGLPALSHPDFSGNGSLSPVIVTGLGSGRGGAANWGQAPMFVPSHPGGTESVVSSSASVHLRFTRPCRRPADLLQPRLVGTRVPRAIFRSNRSSPNASPMPPAHYVSPYACIVSPTFATNGTCNSNGSSPIPFGSHMQQQQPQQYQYQYPPATRPWPTRRPAQQSLPDWAASVELLHNTGSPSVPTMQARHPPPPQLDPMPTHHYSAHSAYETHCSQPGVLPLMAVAAEGSNGGQSHMSSSLSPAKGEQSIE
ncbi:hypothetical protein BCR44DRAFT_1427457 [Catenaria anguillulae PL171]|uniref:Fork-head domain-containing protein n=1 Tax=Catenaria anguillulae PL171 TaxID=765915 RepID=A0A1Y2HZR4_9FUNG|nr:hypothetical protein BCR44DRAFT_1427457 [Catenaria anguillulae PL171]